MLNLSAHEIDALSARGEFGSNRRDSKYFDEKLTELRVNDVENIIARGQLLTEAKDELERGSFEAMVKRHFDLSTARMYRIVAAHPVISDRCHVNALPPSMRALYELTKLSAEVLRAKLRDGTINPKTKRKTSLPGAPSSAAGRSRSTARGSSAGPSVVEQLKAAKAEIAHLKNIVGGEHLFDPNNTNDRQIAETMIGRLEGWRGRARKVAQLMLELLDQQKSKSSA